MVDPNLQVCAHDFIVWVHTYMSKAALMSGGKWKISNFPSMYLPLSMYTRFFHHLNLLLLEYSYVLKEPGGLNEHIGLTKFKKI